VFQLRTGRRYSTRVSARECLPHDPLFETHAPYGGAAVPYPFRIAEHRRRDRRRGTV